MKVSQIREFRTIRQVNDWLKENYHLEIVSISFCTNGEGYAKTKEYMVHYKLNAKVDDGK
jgi:hypothetical protein